MECLTLEEHLLTFMDLSGEQYLIVSNVIYDLQYQIVGEQILCEKDEPTECVCLLIHDQPYFVKEHSRIENEQGEVMGSLFAI